MKSCCTYLFVLIVTTQVSKAQISADSDLFIALKKQDSVFFERAFNQCDMSYLEKAVHRDLVFYHDKSGIQNREKFLENTRKYICPESVKKPVRRADVQSLEVFPLYDNGVLYGVIQSGVHYFYLRESGKADVLTGKAKFTHIYLLQGEEWLLREVLSFDHREP